MQTSSKFPHELGIVARFLRARSIKRELRDLPRSRFRNRERKIAEKVSRRDFETDDLLYHKRLLHPEIDRRVHRARFVPAVDAIRFGEICLAFIERTKRKTRDGNGGDGGGWVGCEV